MAIRPAKTRILIATSAVLAAMLLLAGWQVIQWLQQPGLSVGNAKPSTLYPWLLLIAVTGFFIVAGLLWALLLKTRACHRAESGLQELTRHRDGHLFDITELKSSEQVLRGAIQRLEAAQKLAHFGDWTFDLATGNVNWSPEVYTLLGRDMALGPPGFAEMVDMPLEGPQPMAAAFELAQTMGEPQYFELSTRRLDDTVVMLDVIVQPVSDASGNVTGLRGTMHDVTARKALEQRMSAGKDAAEAASHAKSSFLATMSHEIRTPLNGMLGLLELISLTPASPEVRTALNDVRDSGQSLQRIIDDILDFSKVEAGKLEIRPEASSLVDVVESVHRIYSGSASSVGLEFQLHVDPAISPTLMLDALRIRQILSNFVSNAIKFTPHGRIELRVVLVEREGDIERLRFEVQDTGIGIASDEQESLFEPFEQAQGTASRFGGTGLGLSISRRLAELMDGRVSMSSAVGTGTTMSLEISAAIADPDLAPRRIPDEQRAREALTGMISRSVSAADTDALILVVDDHPTNRMVMRSQINALGYAAEDVESGAAALEQWRSNRFSLVLTDLNMPGMSGFDLSRQIRAAEATRTGPRTPIIACSANAIAGVREDCMNAGMDDYIAKPTRLTELAEKIARWLPTSSAQPHTGTFEQPSPVIDAGERPVAVPEAVVPVAHTIRGDASPPISERALELFRKVNDADTSQLLEAFERGDMAAITHTAHRIKGACGFIGATGLASICGMIEQAGREEDGPGVNWLMDLFHLELEQLNARLDT